VNDALVPGQIVLDQRPSRPDDVEDGLWDLWGRGWNKDPTQRPKMTDYVQHLKQLEPADGMFSCGSDFSMLTNL